MLASTEKASERLPAISSAASDGLPVVELKPFTQKQWRPAHSLPTAYVPRTAYSVGMSPRRTRVYPEPSSVVVSPREPPETVSSARQVFLTSSTRSQNHPKTRDLRLGVQQPQAFVSKVEREKTTTLDIRSAVPSIRNESDPQQSMLVHGRKVNKMPSSRPGSIYAPPWDYYQSSRETSVAVPGMSTVNTPQSSDHELAYVYLDETIYDEFDRSHTLPSISVLPMRRRRRRGRRPQREQSPGSGTSSRRSSGRRSRQEVIRLGVANALDVFSRFGQPLFVERQISFQLKNTMRRLRRNRDTSPVSSASRSMPSTERCDTGIVPTVGEAMIRAGWMMNAGRLPRGYNPLDDSEGYAEQTVPAFGEYAGLDQPVTGRMSVQSPRKRITSVRKRNTVTDVDRKMPNIAELDRKHNIKNTTQLSHPTKFNQMSTTSQPEDVQESAPHVVDQSDENGFQDERSLPFGSAVDIPVEHTGDDTLPDSSPIAEDASEAKDAAINGNDITPPELEADTEDAVGNSEHEVRSERSETIDKDSEIATNVSENN